MLQTDERLNQFIYTVKLKVYLCLKLEKAITM